jgi:hypothetical protein
MDLIRPQNLLPLRGKWLLCLILVGIPLGFGGFVLSRALRNPAPASVDQWRLSRLARAVQMYADDWRVIPPLHNASALQAALYPRYVRDRSAFRDQAGRLFQPNKPLSGLRPHRLRRDALLFSSSAVDSSGRRLAALADGTARRLKPADWVRVSQARYEPPDWTRRVGSAQVLHWTYRPSPDPDEQSTIAVRGRRGKQVASLTYAWTELVSTDDLTGDGHPDVVLTAATGAHGPAFYYVLSLEPTVRCLLAYAKGNINAEPATPDFAVKDLDGDGRQEIITWYDGFAYWEPLPGWLCSFAGCARLPVVLGLRHGRYVDVTATHRKWLRGHLAAAEAELRAALRDAGKNPLAADGLQPMIEHYAIGSLLNGRESALRGTLQLLPRKDRDGLRRGTPHIDAVVSRRGERFRYPSPGGGLPIFPGGPRLFD